MGPALQRKPLHVMSWHYVDVKRRVEYQHMQIKCWVTVEWDINVTKQLRWFRCSHNQTVISCPPGYLPNLTRQSEQHTIT